MLIARAGEARVFAAASLTDALKAISAEYEKETGDKVIFNFGASNFLARQIEAGAPVDIFFSADVAQMDRVRDFIDSATRTNRLSNSLVIVVGKDSKDITVARDLEKATRIALADPQGAPAGIYAKRYLEKAGLWSALSKKIIPMDNVRAALAAVEAGNADAAIVYKTDAAISKHTRVAVEISRSETPRIHYPLAILREAKNPESAKKFFAYLNGKESAAAFVRFGFIIE